MPSEISAIEKVDEITKEDQISKIKRHEQRDPGFLLAQATALKLDLIANDIKTMFAENKKVQEELFELTSLKREVQHHGDIKDKKKLPEKLQEQIKKVEEICKIEIEGIRDIEKEIDHRELTQRFTFNEIQSQATMRKQFFETGQQMLRMTDKSNLIRNQRVG